MKPGTAPKLRLIKFTTAMERPMPEPDSTPNYTQIQPVPSFFLPNEGIGTTGSSFPRTQDVPLADDFDSSERLWTLLKINL